MKTLDRAAPVSPMFMEAKQVSVKSGIEIMCVYISVMYTALSVEVVTEMNSPYATGGSTYLRS